MSYPGNVQNARLSVGHFPPRSVWTSFKLSQMLLVEQGRLCTAGLLLSLPRSLSKLGLASPRQLRAIVEPRFVNSAELSRGKRATTNFQVSTILIVVPHLHLPDRPTHIILCVTTDNLSRLLCYCFCFHTSSLLRLCDNTGYYHSFTNTHYRALLHEHTHHSSAVRDGYHTEPARLTFRSAKCRSSTTCLVRPRQPSTRCAPWGRQPSRQHYGV